MAKSHSKSKSKKVKLNSQTASKHVSLTYAKSSFGILQVAAIVCYFVAAIMVILGPNRKEVLGGKYGYGMVMNATVCYWICFFAIIAQYLLQLLKAACARKARYHLKRRLFWKINLNTAWSCALWLWSCSAACCLCLPLPKAHLEGINILIQSSYFHISGFAFGLIALAITGTHIYLSCRKEGLNQPRR